MQYKNLILEVSKKNNLALKLHTNGFEEVIIISNGWTMSKESEFIKKFVNKLSKAFDVVTFDYRGHGESSGFYTFSGKEIQDLKTIVNYAKSHYKKVNLIGFSLGAAISILYTAEHNDINRLVTVSAPHSFEKIKTFAWLKDFIANPFGKYELDVCKKLRPSLIICKKTKPIDVVDKISIPTLFITGKKDTITPFEYTKKLFNKAKCKKLFEVFENCNHAEDLIYQEEEKLINRCLAWLKG